MIVNWHMPTLRRSSCGLSIRALRLAQGLIAAGHCVTFFVEADKTDIDTPMIDGILVNRLPARRTHPLHWCLQATARMAAAGKVAPRVVGGCDLVVSCQPEVVTACSAVACRPPVVFVCGSSTLLHDEANCADQAALPFFRRWPYAVDRLLKRRNEELAFAAADLIIFDSLQTRDRVIAEYSVTPRLAHTVHGGVDAECFDPPTTTVRRAERSRLGLADDETAVVWTGRFSPEKNLGLLIEAMPRCRRRLSLLLIGEGEQENRLRRLARENGVDDIVRFIGPQSDVRPYLHAADIFAFPSRSESFGGALAEGLACGLPAVGLRPNGHTISNANREIIEHGRCGLLVDHPRAPDFADALNRLAADRALRAQLGAAGRRWVADNFTWKRAAHRFGELLSALPAGPGARCRRSPRPSGPGEGNRMTDSEGRGNSRLIEV